MIIEVESRQVVAVSQSKFRNCINTLTL